MFEDYQLKNLRKKYILQQLKLYDDVYKQNIKIAQKNVHEIYIKCSFYEISIYFSFYLQYKHRTNAGHTSLIRPAKNKLINENIEQFLKSRTFKAMWTPFAALCSSDDRKKKLKKNHIITTKIFNGQMLDKELIHPYHLTLVYENRPLGNNNFLNFYNPFLQSFSTSSLTFPD